MTDRKLEKEIAAIIEQITAAFDGVSREDGVTLHESRAIDDQLSPEKRAILRAKDTEKRWQDVPEEDIRTQHDVLCFLDAKGLRYYLPAYMIAELKSEIDNSPADDVMFFLAYIGDEWSGFALLTTEQSRAVAAFLRFQNQDVEPSEDLWIRTQRALNDYWGKF